MKNTVQSIQFLRFLAASFVVVFHTNLALNKYAFHESSELELDIFYVGGSGVDIFFIISGFIMIYTSYPYFENKNYIKYFLYNRLSRIFPIYWIYCFFYICFRSLFDDNYELTNIELGGALLLIPGYASNIIGPGWTLPYELFFYFTFAVGLILYLKYSFVYLFLLYLGLFLFGIFFDNESAVWHVVTNSHLFEFLIGMVVGLYFITGPRVYKPILFCLFWLSLGLLIIVPLWGGGSLPATLRWGIPASMLVFSLALLDRDYDFKNIVSALVPLGNSSYSLYLLHVLIIDILIKIMAYLKIQYDVENRFFIILFIYVVCLIVSHFCYLFIEMKILRSMKKKVRIENPG